MYSILIISSIDLDMNIKKIFQENIRVRNSLTTEIFGHSIRINI